MLYKLKKTRISTYYLLFLNITMFIVLSSFGQTFLFGTNLSYIFPAFCFLFFLLTINKTPVFISASYLILILYTFTITMFGQDFYYWAIALFTLSTVFIYVLVEIKEEEYSLMFFCSGMFSIIILLLYTNFGFLSNWNPNSLSMFATFGAMGLIIPFYKSDKMIKKVLLLLLILFSIYLIYITESRNNILVYIILLISVFLAPIFRSPLIFRLYYFIGLFGSMIIGKSAAVINNSNWIQPVLDFSYEYFGKGTLFSSREYMWNYSQLLVNRHWLFGTGESLYNYVYSHNMFYSVQYFFGIIGYLLYALFLLVIIEYIYKYAKNDKISLGCILIFIAIMFGQITENALFTSDMSIFLPYVYLSIAIYRAKSMRYRKMKMNGDK